MHMYTYLLQVGIQRFFICWYKLREMMIVSNFPYNSTALIFTGSRDNSFLVRARMWNTLETK